MRPLQSILSDLRERQVRLWLEDGQVRFQAPREALSATLLAELRERKRELAEFLKGRQIAVAPGRVPRVSRVEGLTMAPLSYAQQRLWFLYQYEGPSPTYNILMACRLRGDLNLAALTTSFNDLRQRHLGLRTRFGNGDDGPLQTVHELSALVVRTHDLSGLDGAAGADALAQLKAAEARRRFDLESGPLLAIMLVKERADEHVLIMVMHHIIGDGWSLGVLTRELTAAYAARCAGAAPDLPPCLQYVDYAHWQRKLMPEAVFAPAIERWRTILDDLPPRLEIFAGIERPPTHGHDGETEKLTFPAAVAERLKARCRREGVSMFMMMATLFKVLLLRYSGQSDLLVGTQVANRGRPELESIVGFFINTIVIRTRLDGSPTFSECLARVKSACVEAFELQDVPFERLVEAIQPERDPGANPIVQVMVLWQNAPMGDLALAGIELTLEPIKSVAAKFDLTLDLMETPRGIEGVLEYRTDLFTAGMMRRLVAHLEALAERVADGFDEPVTDFPLAEPSPSPTLAAPAGTIISRFREVVARTPRAVAVRDRNGEIDYANLERRSNQVAHALIRRGVAIEDRVGLCMDRTVDSVATMLGILKAGAAMVPLDPQHPAERRRRIAMDAELVVLIVDAVTDIEFDSVVDFSDLEIGAESAAAPGRVISPAGLAYVIFTSGSTGAPKGVMVEHASVVNLVAGLREAVYPAPDEALNVALLAPYVFDASIQQLFGALLQGHSLCLIEAALRHDATALAARFVAWGIEVADCTPSLLVVMAAGGFFAEPRLSLRQLLCGGEALPWLLLRQVEAAGGGGTAITNVYGPTECCVDVTHYHVPRGVANASGTVPLGHALADAELLVLDGEGLVQPVAIAGELHIGGVALARGYAGSGGRTAERFVPHPYAPGRRLYRTGDLAYVDEQGLLRFLGRNDDQVKVRGYRIELGEVEAALSGLAGVDRAAASVDAATGELRAYVVLSRPLDVLRIRAELARRLPEYMIPARFYEVPTLPMTTSGKLDRRALAGLGSIAAMDSGAAYGAPRSAAEIALVEVWREVLGNAGIGIRDNYFASGGDSIKALQLVSRLRARKLTMGVRELFENPTIEALAPYLKPIESAANSLRDTQGEAPLLPIQRDFLAGHGGDPAHYCQAILLHPTQALDAAALQAALLQVVAVHHGFRLRFAREAAGWRQWYSDEGPHVSFEAVSLTGDFAAALTRHATAVHSSMDLAAGPLFKVVLYAGDAGQRLLLTAHHLVIDAHSWRIVVDDLALAMGGEAPPVEPCSYKDWGLFLARHGERLSTVEREYWQSWVASEIPPLAEPRRAAGRYRDLDTVSIRLDAERTQRLLTRCHVAYRTEINDLILTALCRAVSAWSAQPRVAICLEGHGREELPGGCDHSRTTGWFTTTYPVEFNVGTMDLGRCIKEVKETLRAVPGKGLGFGLWKQGLAASATGISQPEIRFNYLGHFGSASPGSFVRASEDPGVVIDPAGTPGYEIEWLGLIERDVLEFTAAYNRQRFDATSLAGLAQRFEAELAAVIDHASGLGRADLTPSDIDYNGFDIDRLDDFMRGEMNHAPLLNIYPLAPLQEGLYFHWLRDPDASAYGQQLCYTVRGDFDLTLYEQAWRQVIARHDVLRTVFVDGPAGQPLQVVKREQHFALTIVDLSGETDAAQSARRLEFKARDRAQGFDLAAGPIMRVAVLTLGKRLREIVWSHHHILLDGWSLGILQRELTRIMDALTAGHEPELEPPIPYALYIRHAEAQDRAGASAYWAQALRALTQPTGLPAHGRESQGVAARQRRAGVWSAAVTTRLSEMARRQQVTLNTVLHALWSILLARYNDTTDVCFGIAVSGRPADIPGVERLVGLCVNTIPVPVRVAGTARELLHAIQEAALTAEAYQLTPLARIQAQTAWRDGLMPTHLTLENFPLDEQFKRVETVARDGPQVVATEIAEETHFPFDIQFLPAADTLAYRLAYDPEVYDGEQIERTMDQLAYLADQFPAHLDDNVVSLDLEPPPGPLTKAAVAPGCFDSRASLVSLFARTVVKYPDAIAISLEGREMSYRELDEQANRLANWLIEKGVGPGARVALAMDRGVAALVALLGTLKCGAAYLPIDLSCPAARMAFMIRDAQAVLLLTEPEPPAAVSELTIERLEIALDRDDWLRRSAAPPNVAIFADQMAYVIYTSGSTGEPKGVAVGHRQVVRLFAQTQAWYQFSASDVWTWFHSAAFDFSVWEIWGAWLHGGRLVVVPYWVSRSPEEFYRLLSRQRVTVLNQTPSAFYPLIRLDAQGPLLLALRYVVFGGEALNVPALRDWYDHHAEDAPRLVNMYGITETTVHVSYRHLRRDDLLSPASVIGEAIPDQSLHVLDVAMKPVATGVPGELYVGGAGGAWGYLGRPALTAERFVPDPFAAEPGARLYRTGDLARRLANGDLDYLGRCDQQVQLHGFRIELGEVEAVLRQAIDVAQVAVLIRDEEGASAQLAAFVVVAAGAAASVTAWRAHCANFLPAYMIPSSFVSLEGLPLTANGKLDRAALLALRATDAAPEGGCVAPRNDIERALAEVWADVLGRDAVGVTDNYFSLGGDSIRAIQIVSRLRSRDLQVAIRDLMQRQTIEALAPYVDTLAAAIVPIDKAEGTMPLTPIQRRFFAISDSAHFNHTILLKSAAALDAERMHTALASLVRHHAVLRACFPVGARGRELLVRAADAVPVTLSTCDLRRAADPGAEQAAHADGVQRSFKLDDGPLWAAVIYRRDDGDRLFIAMHHLLVDGVSWRILLDDLHTLYALPGGGGVAQMLAASGSFAAWARGLDAYAQSAAVLDQLSYWQLVVAAPRLPLPVDQADGSNCYGDAEVIRFGMNAERSHALLYEAHAAYATTVEDMLVAALAATLREWLGDAGQVIVMEGHGREGVLDDLDFSRTIGWFTALYPFALAWNLEGDLGHRLCQLKESLRRVPARGIGYGLLRYLTRGIDTASLGVDPAIGFNYLGQFDTQSDNGSLAIVREPVGEDVAAAGARPFELEFSAMVMGGRVECQLTFSRRRWQRASLERVFERYLAHLEEIVDHCRSRERPKLTPSDLSYSDLSIDELEGLFDA